MMDMKKYLEPAFAYALARLSEPSTWAANAVIPLLIHTAAPGALGDKVTIILSTIFLTIAGAAREGAPK